MYVNPNFRSKKAVKEALKKGEKVSVFSPGPYPCPTNGTVYLEGPHFPEPHRWYAQATVKDGMVVSVR